eukprot:221616_1
MPSTAIHCMINLYFLSKFCKANLKWSSTFYTILFGSSFPDFNMWIMVAYYITKGYTDKESVMAHKSSGWNSANDYCHSIPIALFASCIAVVVYRLIYSEHFVPLCIQSRSKDQTQNNLINNTNIVTAIELTDTSINNAYDDKPIVMDIDQNIFGSNCRNCWCDGCYFSLNIAYFFVCILSHCVLDFCLHRG